MHKITSFPDKTNMIKVDTFDESFVYRIESYQDLWNLKQLKDVYEHNNLNANIYIPWLIDGQADRRFNHNESFNLKLVCEFLRDMNWKNIFIFHPHNPSIPEAILPNLEIIPNTSFIQEVLKITSSTPSNTVLLSPDAGAFKGLISTAQALQWSGETYSASKARVVSEEGHASLVQCVDRTDFEGKDIIIVDDICIKGGTFIGLAQLLESKNIGKLYLAVSHMTISEPAERLFHYFDRIFTTKSHSAASKIAAPDNKLRIINIF